MINNKLTFLFFIIRLVYRFIIRPLYPIFRNNFVLIMKLLFLIVPLLICIAYFTLAERKILASIQRRKGPNVVGLFGLYQPLADGLKLFVKETLFPSHRDKTLFTIAPILTFAISLLTWAVLPTGLDYQFATSNLGILYIIAMASLHVYGVIMAGWSSNSKYAFLGSLRSTAQIISYEITIFLIIVTIAICVGSLSIIEIILTQHYGAWFICTHFPLFIVYCIAGLAETNRHPFDLPEAESELVSGYNVDYSSMGFALFFLAEYANMLLISSLGTILFLGGWEPLFNFLRFIPGPLWFGLKTSIFVTGFILARAILPRYRYDQLMRLGWKIFIPFTLCWFLLSIGLLIGFNTLP